MSLKNTMYSIRALISETLLAEATATRKERAEGMMLATQRKGL